MNFIEHISLELAYDSAMCHSDWTKSFHGPAANLVCFRGGRLQGGKILEILGCPRSRILGKEMTDVTQDILRLHFGGMKIYQRKNPSRTASGLTYNQKINLDE
jgi:hypothetical protein